jgi:hypothetical protein
MHAVLLEADTSGVDAAEGRKHLLEHIVPGVSQLPGFQSGTWLRPLEDGKGTSVVLFDTEENARAAAQGVQVGSNAAPGVTVLRSEVREVAAQA